MSDGTTKGASILAEISLKDYSKLSNRIRTVEHDVTTGNKRTTLRAHYPALRDSKATIAELVKVMCMHMTHYALPNADIVEMQQEYGKISADDYGALCEIKSAEARKTFKKAKDLNTTNGEGGELLLYLLTEWILEAPQILAKMSLKTNPDMPVHGADGVHMKYIQETNSVAFYWGEAKLYSSLNAGISSAAKSIKESLNSKSEDHELTLVKRNLNLSGLSSQAKQALIKYLDPLEEDSNNKIDIVTCLIAFDYRYYVYLEENRPDNADDLISKDISAALVSACESIKSKFTENSIHNERIEMFLFPVPSVADLRSKFQAEIGLSQ